MPRRAAHGSRTASTCTLNVTASLTKGRPKLMPKSLRRKSPTKSPPRTMAGYGGSVAGAGGRFFVGCPRAGGTGCWRADGAWLGFAPLEEACALAARGAGVWSGGRDRGRWADGPRAVAAPIATSAAGLRLDNHWIALI